MVGKTLSHYKILEPLAAGLDIQLSTAVTAIAYTGDGVTVALADTGIDFVNQVDDRNDFNVLTYRNFYNGGGVAIGDINNDGLADIFFTANHGPDKLYLNKGDFKFEDITQKAGVQGVVSWETGVAMSDINGDGWLDIYAASGFYTAPEELGQTSDL